MLKQVKLGILTIKRIGDKKSGRAFLQLLEPTYTPHRYSIYEPIRTPYSREQIDEAVAVWGDMNFFWKGGPRIHGSAWMGMRVHDSIYLSMPPKAFNLSEIRRIMTHIDKLFGILFAYAHVSSSADTDDMNEYNFYISDYEGGLNTHKLKAGLPGLCWLTVFGQPYQSLFSGKLSSAPVYDVQEVGGATYLQLTENFRDVDKKRSEYKAAQQAAIKHLDNNAFRIMGKTCKYNVPEFNL